jgi:hypothetical protein
VELDILEGVTVEGEMLGLIPTSKYVYHNITDENKFPELVPSKYLKNYISSETQMIVIEPQIWATRLQKERVINLFDIPHFGRSL